MPELKLPLTMFEAFEPKPALPVPVTESEA